MTEQDRTARDKDVVIVVIDDDPAVRGSLAFSLQTEGFEVQTYANGTDLLGQPQLPDRGCVIIDYYLPGMNGLELATALRERQVDLPVILITTHPARTLRQSAAAQGIEIVEKPLFGNHLSERIRAALRPGTPQGK